MTRDADPRRALGATGAAPLVGTADDAEAAAVADAAGPRGPAALGETAVLDGSRFAVALDGAALPGVRSVDLPAGSIELVEGPEGRTRWGRASFDDLEMERGVAPGETQLHDWHVAVAEGRVEDGRRELAVALRDPVGGAQIRWTLSAAWPKRYEPPALDATATGDGPVATESVTVAFDEIERVVETGGAVEAVDEPALSRFVRRANGGRLADGAVVAAGSDLGATEIRPTALTGSPRVAAARVGVLLPAGLRAGGAGSGGDGAGGAAGAALWLVPVIAVEADGPPSVARGAAEDAYWLPGADVFPVREWDAGSGDGDAGGREPTATSTGPAAVSVPGWPAGAAADVDVLLHTGGRSAAEVLGDGPDDASPTAARAGESVPETTVLAVLGPPSPASGEPPLGLAGSVPTDPAALFDAGRPAPLGGATFGLATLSTPDAAVLGESVNPLVGMDTAELLAADAATTVLESAGVTDADAVEYLAGPRAVELDGASATCTLLDEEVDLRTFEGIVDGQHGPWLVGLHVARVTSGDHVVAAGVHSHPVGSAEWPAAEAGWRATLSRGRGLTASAAARLERL